MIDLYQYKATVTDVYDGDTITVDVNLGFNIVSTNTKIRLHGIDTPEIRTRDAEEKKKGLEAKAFLEDLILGRDIFLKTIKDKKGKYGRILGIIFYNGANINEYMVKVGLATSYKG